MRTIKFRAWDRYMKCMVDVKTLDFGPKGAECAVDDSDINGNIDGEWDLMQFTGLRDQYDIEIYEGDIVHWRDSSYIGADVIGEVYFGQGTFRIQPKNQKKVNPPCKDRSISLYDVDSNDLEIIGDIHTGGATHD